MQDQVNLSSELSDVADGRADPAVEALQKELAKWQARVPKLAGALKEKTREVESLRAELAGGRTDLSTDAPDQGSGIRARDALIEELEAKVKALSGKHQDAEGQLHARDLEIAGLRQESAEWRGKWRAATASLDEQSDLSEQRKRELEQQQREVDELLAGQERQSARIKEQDLELTALREKCVSLESRNEKLFETVELANRQIETLGDNLDHLREELKQRNEALAARDAEAGGSSREIEQLRNQLAGRDQDIELLHSQIEEKQKEVGELEGRISELEGLQAAGADAGREQERLNCLLEEKEQELGALADRVSEGQAEIRRLEECVAGAEQTNGRWEAERRELSEQMEELRKRNQHLESQLAERSDLVVGLEQEKSDLSDRTRLLEEENARLSEALEKAERDSAVNADHIAQVDDRLERQKQLMEELEQEFAQAREEHAEAVKAHQRELKEKTDEIGALNERIEDLDRELDQTKSHEGPESDDVVVEENAALQIEIVKLEGMVRERTEQLNKLRWQQDMFEKHAADGTESKMLVVLNQQLASAREDNARLRDRVRELESATEAPEPPDDLAQIRGIGSKLVHELNGQGITRFDQIATLSEADLDDEKHPLHPMKGRILKDGWIEQAARLMSP
jgi:predicted flap endonuclease-1-like 5' DNA nuclease/predicted RNase H-like nuclease (RuvC/YqgF family)